MSSVPTTFLLSSIWMVLLFVEADLCSLFPTVRRIRDAIASAAENARGHAFRAGHVVKPFDLDDLEHRIRTLLADNRSGGERLPFELAVGATSR